ncbi:sulfurtransferase TusA family protein [Neobacillus sp. SM06]|uniref:sulfurtransferase TusA family protein n=1 Tax=Neobacillus sp. SM06 TaxID=3422492 RepID=UPI003D275B7C
MNLTTNKVLDAKGLACPMPIVKTKKAMNELEPGQVMEIQATDKGSKADLKAWAETTGHQYLGTIEEDGVLKHYVRKASESETSEEASYPHVATLEEVLNKLNGDEKITILDVREPAEFAFGHIPGAISIPLGELEERFEELNKDAELHIICRSGSRSDLAAKKLSEKGFTTIKNVIPGMKDWTGPIETTNE